jgi:hypothetical protein
VDNAISTTCWNHQAAACDQIRFFVFVFEWHGNGRSNVSELRQTDTSSPTKATTSSSVHFKTCFKQLTATSNNSFGICGEAIF